MARRPMRRTNLEEPFGVRAWRLNEGTLQPVSDSPPQPDAGEENEAEETAGGVVVARRHAADVLQPVDEAFDPAPEGVEAAINRVLDLAAAPRRDLGRGAPVAGVAADLVAVVC